MLEVRVEWNRSKVRCSRSRRNVIGPRWDIVGPGGMVEMMGESGCDPGKWGLGEGRGDEDVQGGIDEV
jgi:hypothetical protein